MGGGCGMNGKKNKFIQNFVERILCILDVSVGGSLIMNVSSTI